VKIQEQWAEIVRAFNALKEKPGIALTPKTLAPQIAEAGERVRAADHQAWASANRELGAAIQSLKGVVASAMKAETQKLWIIGAATAALVMGFALGTVVPMRIAQSVPESWHWPEQQAADVLMRGEWDAGMRLLQVADPARLSAFEEAGRLAKDNAEALEDCRTRAAQSKVGVKCRIEVGVSLAD
jgi:hypothetical protein